MNISFEIGLRYIDHGNYDKAVTSIKTAIEEETASGSESTAAEYRCVLGELYANMGKINESEQEFIKVLEFCDKNNTLPKQRAIALRYLQTYNSPVARVRRGKSVQDKAFIAKMMNKRK